jgi:hypothetical protein
MQEMVSQLGHEAPVALFMGNHDQEFLSWLNRNLNEEAGYRSHGAFSNVSWITALRGGVS